ncbi:MAG: TetR/AcrR family transcriptional regulator [Burkholderiales bacterium]|jgi:AcrR family transcriptional regulator|nr:TetR/AcrR family transcriptional regulator [Burkholderiales bacterium]
MKKNDQTEVLPRLYGGEEGGERVARRKQQFMDAGLRLFGSGGYRSATVRALCKEAKLTDRYFYESFTSTEQLLIEVYQREIAIIESKLLAAVGELGPDSKLQQVVERALDMFFQAVENPLVARTVWVEILGVSPTVDRVYYDAMARFGAMLMGMVQVVYPNWKIPVVQRQILANSIVGAINQSTTNWLISGFQQKRQDLVAANSLLFKGLISVIEVE